ncbi:cobalt transporter [Canicola haemoglobinophilus]|uniref:Nickel/cobalt efflux system n=1 Tax=Canicola haemoglobinophilus TaxID=733 RepID=A0A1V4B1R2_9PAST|nr:zinc transporter permease subunit ZevB [Canicola haemoglobinophilus]OOS01100.1 cobalt transporter [Canicola haemoglobinophilus]STO54237.1 permease [Canicola haemoglobinophilus]STO60340.1 permease [Canicola haemoglobinophilus]STO68770.1 permease [Canicola haemoglobinophilus]
MSIKTNYKLILLFLFLSFSSIYLFPYLFSQVLIWQREFNQLISGYLHQIKQAPIHSGVGLIVMSFIYGIFHALGPGHGKFVIGSYLATHQSQLKASMKLTFLSSLMQGIVAISLTSILVAILNLSSSYFKLSQLWLERGAYLLLAILGLQWILQGLKSVRKKSVQQPKIKRLNPISMQFNKIGIQSAVLNQREIHVHTEHCSCGHQHLPNQQQLQQAQSLKSQFLIILTIGMRPCSGAIFVLFLAYMLDLYFWGMLATLAMSLGTGLMLSGFALIVLYARKSAVQLGNFYFARNKDHWAIFVRMFAGAIMLFFALTLIYGTTLPVRGGALLIGGS